MLLLYCFKIRLGSDSDFSLRFIKYFVELIQEFIQKFFYENYARVLVVVRVFIRVKYFDGIRYVFVILFDLFFGFFWLVYVVVFADVIEGQNCIYIVVDVNVFYFYFVFYIVFLVRGRLQGVGRWALIFYFLDFLGGFFVFV